MNPSGAICLDDPLILRDTYDRYYRPLCFFGRRYIHDIDEVEDMVQDIFVTLAERRMAFANKAALNSYLYRAVSNAAINRSVLDNIHKKHHAIMAKNVKPYIEDEVEFAAAMVEDRKSVV